MCREKNSHQVQQNHLWSEPHVQTHVPSGQQLPLSWVLLTSGCEPVCPVSPPGLGTGSSIHKPQGSVFMQGTPQERRQTPLQTGSMLIVHYVDAARTAPLQEEAPGQVPRRTPRPKHCNDLLRGEQGNRKQEGQKGWDQVSSSLDGPLASPSLSSYLSAVGGRHTFTSALCTVS